MYKTCRKVASFSTKKENPFNKIVQSLNAGGKSHKYFGLAQLNDPRLGTTYLTQTTSLSVLESSLKVPSETVISLKSNPLMLKTFSTGK